MTSDIAMSSASTAVGPRAPQLQRKLKKPLMEKKRRARINQCLTDLKNLLLQSAAPQGAKLEKADILEMTVHYLQNTRNGSPSQDNAAVALAKFTEGYKACVSSVVQFLSVGLPGSHSDLNSRIPESTRIALTTALMSHLHQTAIQLTASQQYQQQHKMQQQQQLIQQQQQQPCQVRDQKPTSSASTSFNLQQQQIQGQSQATGNRQPHQPKTDNTPCAAPTPTTTRHPDQMPSTSSASHMQRQQNNLPQEPHFSAFKPTHSGQNSLKLIISQSNHQQQQPQQQALNYVKIQLPAGPARPDPSATPPFTLAHMPHHQQFSPQPLHSGGSTCSSGSSTCSSRDTMSPLIDVEDCPMTPVSQTSGQSAKGGEAVWRPW